MNSESRTATASLIERLEQAMGPDREIDYAIDTALHPFLAEQGYERRTGDRGWFSPTPHTKGAEHVAPAYAYTDSIDAAISLVPEGAGLHLERYWLSAREGWTASLFTGGIPSCPAQQFVSEDAHNAAIALCIAALKARSAVGDREGDAAGSESA